MPAIEARAEIFLMTLRSLSKKEREQILTRLLEDEEFREDVLDIALYESRKDEPSRPFRDYLAERRKKVPDGLLRQHHKRC